MMTRAEKGFLLSAFFYVYVTVKNDGMVERA